MKNLRNKFKKSLYILLSTTIIFSNFNVYAINTSDSFISNLEENTTTEKDSTEFSYSESDLENNNIVMENLDYNEYSLSISSVETLTINPNGGSATHINGATITSSTAQTLGSLINIGETKSFSTGIQTIDIDGSYHFEVQGGKGGSATFTNGGIPIISASGGNGVKITSNSVSIPKGTTLTFYDGETSQNISGEKLAHFTSVSGTNEFGGTGYDIYILNGVTYSITDYYQSIWGDGGKCSYVNFDGHSIYAAGGGGGSVYQFAYLGTPNPWSGEGSLTGINAPLNTSDNTSAVNYCDFDKAYINNYGGYFSSGSGLWEIGYQHGGGEGYKNGKYGGYGSNAVAGGSCGQSYVSGFVATYATNTTLESYVNMTCDSKTFTINDPIRNGYTFTGWTISGTGVTQRDNGTTTTFTKSSSGNMTITANWSVNSYNVTCVDYLTDKTTKIGTQAAKSYTYGATAKGSDWGTSSPYNNTQYTYTYNSCTSVTVNGIKTVYRYWTRTLNQYSVTYIDVVDSTSGKQLCKTTKNVNYGYTVKGSDLGNSTSDNAYYNGYYYVSDTSATVTTNGATVYRIFKQRTTEISGNIIWDDWNNKNSSRPSELTLYIYGSDGNTYNYQISGDNSKNTTINSWIYSENVPKYDSNGKVITYTVNQNKVKSQETGIAYNEPIVNKYNITDIASTKENVKPEIETQITIEWIDNDNQYSFRPNEVIIQLLQNGIVIKEAITSETSYTFDELYKYDENGNLYTYTINSNDVDRYSKSIDNDSNIYEKDITYEFINPTFSVTIPKTVVLDGKTGIGEYTVSVQGNIDDRDSVNVVPDSSFTMENKYLSPTTAIVKQTITSFTNKNNIKDGTTTTGTIITDSLAGQWFGIFNFKVYFKFGN